MIEKIKLKYIILYILFVGLQLTIFSPQIVVGINVPILFTYAFELLDNPRIVSIRKAITFDTTFLAILLSLASITLILSNVAFIGTWLMILTIALLWKRKEE